MDVDSCIIREWIVTKGNILDSKVSYDLIDSVRNYSYILNDILCGYVGGEFNITYS